MPDATPLTLDALRGVAASLPDSLKGRRDRCLLLLGFAGALRLEELRRLRVDDVDAAGEALVLRLGHGRSVVVPHGTAPETCPVCAYHAWCAAAAIAHGAVLRPVSRHGHVGAGPLSARAVNLILRQAVARAGLEGCYSSRSLRRGFLVSAVAAAVPEDAILQHAGLRTPRLVRRLAQGVVVPPPNPAALVGL
jgi:integrase